LLVVFAALLSVDSGAALGQTIIIEPVPMPIPVPPLPPPPGEPRPEPRIVPPRPPLPPHAGLTIKQETVQATIVDGVAVTNLEQVFFNQYEHRIEGTYIFPLPDDIGLSKFSMYVNGQEVEGKLLPVEEARQVYQSIVSKMRDPALLEYIGTRMFRARIFPIEPKSEVRVKLSYTQMLSTEEGLVRYRYPFKASGWLPAPIESASFVVNITSKTGIKSVFSPTHQLAISRPSDHNATASFEARNFPADKDLDLFYALSEKEFGLTVLTYRETGSDGFFVTRIAPPAQTADANVLPKDICFVIDTSGSMADDNKIEQARRALKFCLSNLNPQDKFNIIPFAHEPVRFKEGLVPADAGNVQAARDYADALRATGGTNINDALLLALAAAPAADETRPYLIVFLTDGLPTVGVTDVQEILKGVAGKNTARVRLFVFGVGHDVNTQLLDLLAEQNRGARDYVAPGEDLELKLSGFYRKVADPVLGDLELKFPGLEVYDLFPPKLADLFAGTELVVVGRYRGEGPKTVELTGTRRGTKERFVYETTFPAEARQHTFLPPLWATRKVGYLLDQIRLHGENKELKDTIVQLATQYGIVTPYTAYLVTEPGSALPPPAIAGVALRARMEQRAARGGGAGARRMSPAMSSGVESVMASQAASSMKSMDAGPAFFEQDFAGVGGGMGGRATPLVARVDARTFYRIDDKWVDGAYKKDSETKKVEAYSDPYFELVRKHPELAKCFALGERVIVVLDGTAYETVPPPRPEAPQDQPATP